MVLSTTKDFNIYMNMFIYFPHIPTKPSLFFAEGKSPSALGVKHAIKIATYPPVIEASD